MESRALRHFVEQGDIEFYVRGFQKVPTQVDEEGMFRAYGK